MKKLTFLLFVCISFIVSAQKAVDTSQVKIPGRANTAASLTKPYVILISSDGFRYDYLKKYDATNLMNLAENGVWARKGMYPSYPSITFPNHYAIVTGLYPAHHGIVDNAFYDPERNEKYALGTASILDGSWYGGEPLWGLAEKQGMMAASLFWVGSESDAGGMRPSYYYRYHEKFTDDDKVRIIKDWLTLPEDVRPHFITLYFPEVDHMGHKYGPDAPQTEESVHYVDTAIRKLVDGLKPLNLPINYIFVSDHGMIAIDKKDQIPMPAIDPEKYIVINSGTFARITAKDKADIMPLYNALQAGDHKNYRVYLAQDFPKKLHYSTREDTTRRIGDIILVPKGSKALVDVGKRTSYGKHGFDSHKVKEMKATFIAWGPAFDAPMKIRSFENINIYPMIAKILGLNITQPIDGKLEVLDKILRK